MHIFKNKNMIGKLYTESTEIAEKFEVIVIGSGIGGLSVASILAKEGKKVLILEQHYVLGGYTHCFRANGYEWDVGLHYVGQVHIPGTMLNKAFNYVSDGNLKWAPLDDEYDRIVIGDKKHYFRKGRENFITDLKNWFPDEKDQESIDKYFLLLQEVENIGPGYFQAKALPPVLNKLFAGLMSRKFYKHSDKTTLEVLKSITDNNKLMGVLTAQYGDYGMLPADSSFYMHAIVANHYMEGAGYPVGGSKSLAATMIPVIEKAGGASYFGAKVAHIKVDGNRAVGVVMEDGKEILADTVISDAGVITTFADLIPEELAAKHKLTEKLENVKPSATYVGLYAGLKGSVQELKLPACNYWVFPNQYDHQKARDDYKSLEDEIPVAYISFPAAKDPVWQRNHPDKSTLEIIIILPYEWFDKWKHTEWQKRDGEYAAMKEKIAQKMLQVLYKVEPQLESAIDTYEVSTPLSTRHFMNHDKGEMYGVDHSPKRFRQDFLRPHTPIKNLFLTGQDTMVASISGGMMGGVLCASAILKKNILNKMQNL